MKLTIETEPLIDLLKLMCPDSASKNLDRLIPETLARPQAHCLEAMKLIAESTHEREFAMGAISMLTWAIASQNTGFQELVLGAKAAMELGKTVHKDLHERIAKIGEETTAKLAQGQNNGNPGKPGIHAV